MLSSIDSQMTDLKTLRSKYSNNIILSYLNINSVRNKLNDLKSVIFPCVDLVCIAESKLDDSFPESQFMVPGFKTYRFDVTADSGGLLMFVNDTIPSRTLTHNLPTDIQCIPIELNLRKQKWLILGIYRPPSQNLKSFIENISNQLDVISVYYDNINCSGRFQCYPI